VPLDNDVGRSVLRLPLGMSEAWKHGAVWPHLQGVVLDLVVREAHIGAAAEHFAVGLASDGWLKWKPGVPEWPIGQHSSRAGNGMSDRCSVGWASPWRGNASR
jgi:hypothetical protein